MRIQQPHAYISWKKLLENKSYDAHTFFVGVYIYSFTSKNFCFHLIAAQSHVAYYTCLLFFVPVITVVLSYMDMTQSFFLKFFTYIHENTKVTLKIRKSTLGMALRNVWIDSSEKWWVFNFSWMHVCETKVWCCAVSDADLNLSKR